MQALMDLVTIISTRKRPNRFSCPVRNFCIAYARYDPHDFHKKEMNKIIPLKEVGIGIVFNREGKLLIDQRPENSSMGGMWEFPGGKKKPDESIIETIEREIKEEIGIVIELGAKLLSFDHSYSHETIHFTVHICELKSGEPQPLASQKLLWVFPEKLIDFHFPAANNKIISELFKHLGIRKN